MNDPILLRYQREKRRNLVIVAFNLHLYPLSSLLVPLRIAGGTLDLEKMEEYVHTDADVHFAPTRLVCLEQTHNHCGGVVLPIEHMQAVRGFCDRHGLKLHLDGARLFNAVAATGVPAAEYAALCDTVSICLSKGLGAPVGSVLVGDAATLRLAARARKIYGGGMRQAGILAAAGLYALEHNVARMADDQRRTRRLAAGLAALPGLAVDLETVQTNMVFAGTQGTGMPAAALVERLGGEGVLCLDEGPSSVRFVTHLDVDDGDIEETLAVVARVLAATV